MTERIITIDNKEYEIKFTINTLCDMTKTGINIMKLNEEDFDIVMIRSLFYFGLKSSDKKMTESKAGDLMDEYIHQEGNDFGKLTQEVMAAFADSLGTKAKDKESEDEDTRAK